MTQITEEWLTREEVGALLKVHPRTVDRWVRQELITSYKVGTLATVRFRKADVEALMVPTKN